MSIQVIHSFLAHPRKGLAAHSVRGTRLPQEGRLFALLNGIYERATSECDIDICFRPDERGMQSNPCRTLFLNYLEKHNISSARAIAQRLESVTDRRSGLGLLFLMYGTQGQSSRLVVSRFPTDEGISADETTSGLSVQYLERVFLKNKHSYKAVCYDGRSLQSTLWLGKAVDRQNSEQGTLFSSNYWISDFLCSDLSITGAAGTRRLGIAYREALKKAEPNVRRELVAAATLATGLRNQSVSISSIADRFNLSDDARTAVENELKSPNSAIERFKFDETEFNSVVGILSIELNNGGIITAPSGKFDEVFSRREIRDTQETEFKTKGVIINQRLKSSL